MPTIAFSDGFMSGSATTFMGRFMSYGVNNNSSDLTVQGLLSRGNAAAGAPPSKACAIALMKGAVPTDFTGLTTFGSRSADILCQWIYAINTNNLSPSVPNTNPAVITSDFVAATASGTATWFWWRTVAAANIGSQPNWSSSSTLYDQIIGTVGTVGSGSDLEIPSTTITSTQLLRILNLRLQLPSTYNY